MKTLNRDLKHKVEVWLSPLPEKFQGLVWEALRNTENTEASFNPRAHDFSEMLMWHLPPAGSYFWESVHQITEFFWKRKLDQLVDPVHGEVAGRFCEVLEI